MTCPRSTQVSLPDTPWYHVVSRCVRRAFLCGEDRVSGQNFDHRRDWLITWILRLADIFAIDVASYAVMSNHYHIVVRIDAERAATWSVEEVLERWTRLFSGPVLIQRYLSDARDTMTEAECERVRELAEEYRERLMNLSWFMRVLNENIAREANREDGVKGRFWEGRFKSQALLDEIALLSAMAYVDLNPIRAGLAATPEESDHTSIQSRIGALTAEQTSTTSTLPQKSGLIPRLAQDVEPVTITREQSNEMEVEKSVSLVTPDPELALPLPFTRDAEPQKTPIIKALESLHDTSMLSDLPQAQLMPFDATGRFEQAIPFAFDDYLELVDTVGRTIRPDKRCSISQTIPGILTRLGIDTEAFIAHAGRFLKEFGHAVGRPERLVALAEKRQTKYLRGIATAKGVRPVFK